MYYEIASFTGTLVQEVCIFVCLLSYICAPTNRKASALILLVFYTLYANVAATVFGEVASWTYLLESASFFTWALILLVRHERHTLPNIDTGNVLLVFYKGTKGSLIMRFVEIFGLSVKSMCIVADTKCIRLSEGKDNFLVKSSASIMKKQEEYVMIDTGKKVTPEFIAAMEETAVQASVKKCGLRTQCIEGLDPLLALLGEEYKPKGWLDYFPSRYLNKVINRPYETADI